MAKIVCKNCTYLCVLADSKHYVPLKLMSNTGNSREFTSRNNVQKNHINITKHLIWDTLDIKQPSVMFKLGNTEIASTSW